MTQAAVSVVLIVLATLFVRATVRSATIDVGFDAPGLYAVASGFGAAVDDGVRLKSLWTRARSELQTVPGIAAVTLADRTPFGDISRTSITHDEPPRVIELTGTDAEYFATIGLRLLAGRTYTRAEVAARAPVAVVSQSLAQTYWRGESPLGRLLPPAIPVAETRPVVIGVVADAILARLHERNALAVYEPIGPMGEQYGQLLIRMAPGTAGVVERASQRLRAIDPRADVTIASIDARLRQEASRPRMLAGLTGTVGLIAIVLCVIGLYGLTASVVGQRTREMGVRVALGAAPRDLLRLLMWESLRPVAIGLAIGAGTALLASRVVVAAVFFGVSPQDPMAFAAAAVILLAAAMLAVLVPTRRAAAVDAAIMLRQL
jgi:hypothetical protein